MIDGKVAVAVVGLSLIHISIIQRSLHSLFQEFTGNTIVIAYKTKLQIPYPDPITYFCNLNYKKAHVKAVSYTHLDVYKRQG